jgi:hypothetical protein
MASNVGLLFLAPSSALQCPTERLKGWPHISYFDETLVIHEILPSLIKRGILLMKETFDDSLERCVQ